MLNERLSQDFISLPIATQRTKRKCLIEYQKHYTLIGTLKLYSTKIKIHKFLSAFPLPFQIIIVFLQKIIGK